MTVDERAIVKLTEAEESARQANFAKSLAILLDYAATKPSARILDRVQCRYFDVLGSWFRAEIIRSAGTTKWKSIGVATFVGTSKSEGISIRDRICFALADNIALHTQVFTISEDGAQALQCGEYDRMPKADQKKIVELGIDAVVFGNVDRELKAYVYDVRVHKTRPLLSVTPISRVPGLPSNLSTWSRLPVKASTNRGMRIEVWTEKSEYEVGNEVIFYIRSTQDCYVTLVDLQTSGGLYVLFPNSFQEDNFIRGGRIYTIPARDSTFTINASGPPGLEGIKAIATKKKLSLAQARGGETFIVLRTADAQTEFAKTIADSMLGMPEEQWDIAEWVFEVQK